MKFWKKLLSMVLCLALVVGTMPIAPAMAASTDLEVLNGQLAAGDYTIAANKTLEVTKQTSIQTGDYVHYRCEYGDLCCKVEERFGKQCNYWC